jgi:hypothetical protein
VALEASLETLQELKVEELKSDVVHITGRNKDSPSKPQIFCYRLSAQAHLATFGRAVRKDLWSQGVDSATLHDDGKTVETQAPRTGL